MIYLKLFLEFFRVGLFAVGGGLATIPFLSDLGQRTGWFTQDQLADMLAVSESTPGPIGVNMAVYTGFTVAGMLGSVVAVLGLVAPSWIVILLVARVLQKFRQSRLVDGLFYGLRPASVALITAAGISVARIALFSPLNWKAIGIAAVTFLCLRLPRLKKLHPVLFLLVSAGLGILFRL
jgi:chromate transporter